MRTRIFILQWFAIVSMLVIVSLASWAGEVDSAERRTQAYFQALQEGDVQAVTSMLIDPILSTKKLLLEKNTGYPDYLRKHYRETEIQIIEVSPMDENAKYVDVAILFPEDANPLKIRIVLQLSDGEWKISNELRLLD